MENSRGDEQSWSSNKTLVVLTKNFGTNFTGATVATHELIKIWIKSFKKVIVITQNVGNYDLDNINIIKINNIREAKKIIQNIKLKNDNIVGYSDDHLGFLLKLNRIKYFHTYHGNWPDAMFVNFTMFIKSFIFIKLYKMTLKGAEQVINVSYYMDKYTRRFNDNTVIIRNGVNQKIENIDNKKNETEKINIIMVGNIDQRKYKLAIKLFKNTKCQNINVDIYGKVVDNKLSRKLEGFSFVNIIGFKDTIDYSNYDIMLNASSIENLPISICEALLSCKPVIAFNVGGISEVLINGVNGFVLSKTKLDIFNKIIEQISNNRYEFVFNDSLNSFDWEKSATIYLKNMLINY